MIFKVLNCIYSTLNLRFHKYLVTKVFTYYSKCVVIDITYFQVAAINN